LAIDASGTITITGRTNDPGYPVTPGAHKEETILFGGNKDYYVSRLDPKGRRLLYSTFLGGLGAEGVDTPIPCAIGPDGSAVLGGDTVSPDDDYPVTEGALQEHSSGQGDAVLTKLDMLPEGVTRAGVATPGGRGAPILGAWAKPAPGLDFGLYASCAPPSSPGWLLVASAPATSPMPLERAALWLDPEAIVALQPFPTGNQGYAEFPARVPDAVGATVWVQAFWPDGVAPGGWAASHALGLTILP
jgi:hypothetical protein